MKKALFVKAFFIGILVIASVVLLFSLGAKRRLYLDRVSEWPVTAATVLESDVKEFAVGDYSGFIMHVSVRLTLQYKVDGKTFDTVFQRTFQRTTLIDYKTALSPENKIEIRYSPSDPEIVSLYPLIYD